MNPNHLNAYEVLKEEELQDTFLYPRKESGKNGIIKNRDAAFAAAPVYHRRRRGRFCDFV